MMIYGLVSAVSLVLTPFANTNKRNKMTSVIICALIMGFFVGFRTWWLADNIKYHTQFVTIGASSLKEMLEESVFNIGLRYYFHIIYTYFNMNFQIALLGIAILQMSCLSYVIYHYSPSIFWSCFTYIFLGFYFFIFSGLKQGVAMAFLLVAFTGILEKKPLKFILFAVLGGIFHAPAFIFLAAYPWANARFGRYYFAILLALFVGVLLFRTQIVTILGNMYYEEAEYVSSGKIGGKFLAMVGILVLSIFIRPVSSDDEVYFKTFNLVVLATLLQSFSIFGNTFTRLADYYFQFSILLVPLVMQYRPEEEIPDTAIPMIRFTQQSYLIAGIVLFLLGTVYYMRYISSDITGIADVRFFWEVANTPWGS